MQETNDTENLDSNQTDHWIFYPFKNELHFSQIIPKHSSVLTESSLSQFD
jgi:hypothetical protein